MAKRRTRRPSRPPARLDRNRLAAARSVGLSFPEPFFWTTGPFARLQRLDPGAGEFGYRELFFFARALEVYSAPAAMVRIVAEGDSWFAHPCITDITDWLPDHNYKPYGSEAPGRRLAEMVRDAAYLKYLDDPRVRAVILSGGGNDLIGWKRSDGSPSPIFRSAPGSKNPADYLSPAELDEAFAEIGRLLGEFARGVRAKRPGLPIVTHAYDWIEPRTSGPLGAWIGPQLTQVGVPDDQRLRNGIGRLLIDQTNEAYHAACAAHAMTHVDLRGIVSGRWWDEIHPSSEAFHDITVKIATALKASRKRRRRAPSAGRRARIGTARRSN